MKINEVAKLTGITVRTLHYYDEIGLLPPSKITEAGYRIYDDKALETLQQILFFRELEIPLSDIKRIMESPAYDKKEALHNHREILIKKRDRLNELITLAEDTIKGGKDMSFKQFDRKEIEQAKLRYAEEVKERWGETAAYKESFSKTKTYDEKQWQFLTQEGADILRAFGESRELSPESGEAQALVKKWQDYITDNFYQCSNEILAGLGLMYTEDKRFTENIDKNGAGTAEFMSKAIEVYCGK